MRFATNAEILRSSIEHEDFAFTIEHPNSLSSLRKDKPAWMCLPIWWVDCRCKLDAHARQDHGARRTGSYVNAVGFTDSYGPTGNRIMVRTERGDELRVGRCRRRKRRRQRGRAAAAGKNESAQRQCCQAHARSDHGSRCMPINHDWQERREGR